MSDYRILITSKLDGCPEALNAFEGVGTADIVADTTEAVAAVIGDYDAYLAALTVPIDRDMVRRAKRLKVIGTPTTGTDHLDLAAIGEAGIACFDISKELELIRSFTATSE